MSFFVYLCFTELRQPDMLITVLFLFLQLFFGVGNAQTDFTTRINNALICETTLTNNNYLIREAKICKNVPIAKVSSCAANVFDVNLARVPVRGYFCSMKVQRYRMTMYFWGEKVLTRDDSEFLAPSLQECNLMYENKYLEKVGPLQEYSPGIWKSDNTITESYLWMRTLQGANVNGFLQMTNLFYNVVTREIMTDLETISHCKYETGFCRTHNKILVWETNELDLCSYVRAAKVHVNTAKLHHDKDLKLVRLDIPSITSTFYDFQEVETHVMTCFKGKNNRVLGTYQGLIIQLLDCSKKFKNFAHLKEDFIEKLKINSTGERMVQRVSAEFNYLFNIQRQILIKLQSQVNYLECQQSNFIRKNMKLLARSYPSAILSEILGRPAAAVINNDILSERGCERKNLTLMTTLWQKDGTFATKPIAMAKVFNETVLYQLQEENVWSREINFVTQKPIKGYLSFFVGGKIWSFLNGTILRTPLPVNVIGAKIGNLSVAIPQNDFTKSDLMLGRPLESDSVLAMKIALSGLQFDEQLNSFRDRRNTNFMNLTRSKMYGSLLAPLARIRHPVTISIFSVMGFLSNFWGLFLTGSAIYAIYQFCKGRKKHRSPEHVPTNDSRIYTGRNDLPRPPAHLESQM